MCFPNNLPCQAWWPRGYRQQLLDDFVILRLSIPNRDNNCQICHFNYRRSLPVRPQPRVCMGSTASCWTGTARCRTSSSPFAPHQQKHDKRPTSLRTARLVELWK